MSIGNYAHCVCNDSRHFFILSLSADVLYDFYWDCRSFHFHLLIKSTFPSIKELLCLYDEENNAWLLVDMKVLFSCST